MRRSRTVVWDLQSKLSFTHRSGQLFKLFIVMKYDRHKNWLYADWFSSMRGCRIIQVKTFHQKSFCLTCPENFEMVSILFLLTFLGYYLTIHKKAIIVSLPLIQIIAAFPVPAYFPFLYAITSPYFHAVLGDASTEFYVLLLCLISIMYYLTSGLEFRLSLQNSGN